MPWLCAYRPVRSDPREGQQSGVVTNALEYVTPVRRSHRRGILRATTVSPRPRSAGTHRPMMGGHGDAGSPLLLLPAFSHPVLPAAAAADVWARPPVQQFVSAAADQPVSPA